MPSPGIAAWRALYVYRAYARRCELKIVSDGPVKFFPFLSIRLQFVEVRRESYKSRNARVLTKLTGVAFEQSPENSSLGSTCPLARTRSPGDKFLYVFHCHIFEDEENEMMRPYVVLG
jgi:hypothetical protein